MICTHQAQCSKIFKIHKKIFCFIPKIFKIKKKKRDFWKIIRRCKRKVSPINFRFFPGLELFVHQYENFSFTYVRYQYENFSFTNESYAPDLCTYCCLTLVYYRPISYVYAGVKWVASHHFLMVLPDPEIFASLFLLIFKKRRILLEKNTKLLKNGVSSFYPSKTAYFDD